MNVLLKQVPRPPGVGDSVTHEDEVGTIRKYRHKRLLKTHFKKKKQPAFIGWGCGSVVRCLSFMPGALDLILAPLTPNKERKLGGQGPGVQPLTVPACLECMRKKPDSCG